MTESGTPAEAHSFRKRVFGPAATRAGVPWATPHKLRHTAGTLLADGGASAVQIAAFLGHTDPAFTQRTYIHASTPLDVETLGAALR